MLKDECFSLSSGNPHGKVAQQHLDLLSELLTKLDPSGALASTSSMGAEEAKSNEANNNSDVMSNNIPKRKRGRNETMGENHEGGIMDRNSSGTTKKKKNSNEPSKKQNIPASELTVEDRENRALENLYNYLEREFKGTCM